MKRTAGFEISNEKKFKRMFHRLEKKRNDATVYKKRERWSS